MGIQYTAAVNYFPLIWTQILFENQYSTTEICVRFLCIHYYTFISNNPSQRTQFCSFIVRKLGVICVQRVDIQYTGAIYYLTLIWTQIPSAQRLVFQCFCVQYPSIQYTDTFSYIPLLLTQIRYPSMPYPGSFCVHQPGIQYTFIIFSFSLVWTLDH